MKTMSRLLTIIAAAMMAAALTGCDSHPKSPRGFRLPDGDAEKGRAAFVALECFRCHAVDGVEFPKTNQPVVKSPVLLGGEVTVTKTYGELVTSVINPSHKLSPQMKTDWEREAKLSPMPVYNDAMTVSQMIDLVAFLQPHYKKLEMDYQYYP